MTFCHRVGATNTVLFDDRRLPSGLYGIKSYAMTIKSFKSSKLKIQDKFPIWQTCFLRWTAKDNTSTHKICFKMGIFFNKSEKRMIDPVKI